MNKIEVKEYLKNILEENRVFHSYLFFGPEVEEIKEDILLFLYEIVTKNIEGEKKEQLISNIKNGNIDDFKIVDRK